MHSRSRNKHRIQNETSPGQLPRISWAITQLREELLCVGPGNQITSHPDQPACPLPILCSTGKQRNQAGYWLRLEPRIQIIWVPATCISPLVLTNGESWSEIWVQGSHPQALPPALKKGSFPTKFLPQSMESPMRKRKLAFPKGRAWGLLLAPKSWSGFVIGHQQAKPHFDREGEACSKPLMSPESGSG